YALPRFSRRTGWARLIAPTVARRSALPISQCVPRSPHISCYSVANFPKLKPDEIPDEVREARNKRRQHTEKARRDIEAHVEPITAVMIEKAKAGDVRAARLCLDKVLSPAKGERVKIIDIDNPDPQVAADSVMGYLARGDIDPEQASHCLDAVAKR